MKGKLCLCVVAALSSSSATQKVGETVSSCATGKDVSAVAERNATSPVFTALKSAGNSAVCRNLTASRAWRLSPGTGVTSGDPAPIIHS